MRISSRRAFGALPLVLILTSCGRDTRIHEPQTSSGAFGISARSASDVSEWSEPVNLGAVNSPFADIAPEISKDGLSLYFASNRPGGLGANDIYVAQRASVDDPWGAPVNLGPVINSALADAGPHLSRDGHWLFFSSARPGGVGGNDLYVSYRKNTHDDFAWEAPVTLGARVNSALSDLGPSVWGPELYFWRGPPPAQVPGDIYLSRIRGHEFGDAELVLELSSSSHDEKPGIRFDGRQILIASDRPGSVGNVDIWIATREGSGRAWGTPVNMIAINSTAGDRRPSFSPDGEMILFDSDRPGGSGSFDLYVSTRNARPER
jgi:hypothetical protein